MKKFLILVMLLAIVPAMAAQENRSIAVGKIHIEILNDPPVITDVNITQQAYQDTPIVCEAAIIDEHPKDIRFEYEWYKDDVLVSESSNSYIAGEGGVEVRCVVTAIDLVGQESGPKSASVYVDETALSTQSVMFLMSGFGIEKDVHDTLALQQQGLGSITGMVVGEVNGNSQARFASLLVITLVMLIVVNLNLYIRFKRSYSISP